MKQSCKDTQRHKCQFCLSFCSVFIVVLSVLVVNSVIAKGPVIFLKLSETFVGEYDGVFYNREVDYSIGWTATYDDSGYYIDYNAVKELDDFDKHNLSPRYQTCDTLIYIGDLSDNNDLTSRTNHNEVNIDSLSKLP